MRFYKSGKQPPMSAAASTIQQVRRLAQREARGPGDVDNALQRLSQESGIGFWTLWHLYQQRAKTVEAGLRDRIRALYIARCEREIAVLQHELAFERALGGDDALEDLEAEAAALAAKIAAARARRGGGR